MWPKRPSRSSPAFTASSTPSSCTRPLNETFVPGHVGLMRDRISPRKWTSSGWCFRPRRTTTCRSSLIPASPPLAPPPPPCPRWWRGRAVSTPDTQLTKGDSMSFLSASPGPEQPAHLGDQMSSRNEIKAHSLGLTSATGLVIGSIVGTGVFTMPAVLAGAGTMSLVVLGVIAVGALLLGVLFGQLTKRVPNSDGGVYAYSRHEFGDFAGYLVGWCYWIQAWAGNAAIVASWVFYVDALFSINHPSGMENWGIALLGLWIPAIVNLVGVRQMAWFQNVTVVLKFLPLLFVGIVGWFFVQKAHFGAFNASGGSLYSGIGIAAGVALFSFIGVGHGSQRHALRARDCGGDGTRVPPHARQDGRAICERLPEHLPPRGVV